MNKSEIAQHMVKDSTIIKNNAIKVIEKKAKVGRNPKTGAKINIPKKKVPKFVAGKELKTLVK